MRLPSVPGPARAARTPTPTLQAKAAALAESLCRNHALVDGNKRLTLTAVRTFLRINGFDLELDDDAKFDLIMDIASGQLRSVPAIAERMPVVRRVTTGRG